MNPRERIEKSAQLYGWTVHFGGYRTLRGITLRKGRQRMIQVDLDRQHDKVQRGALLVPFPYGEWRIAKVIETGERDKLRKILRMVEAR